jgi:hypothetical protein
VSEVRYAMHLDYEREPRAETEPTQAIEPPRR